MSRGIAMISVRRELPVELSLEELKSKSDELVDVIFKKSGLMEEKKSAVAAYNSEIKELESKIPGLAQIIKSGQEWRQVECEKRAVFETNTIEVWRLDTNKRVEVRAMTAEEREEMSQEGLFEESAGG